MEVLAHEWPTFVKNGLVLDPREGYGPVLTGPSGPVSTGSN